MEQGKLPLKTDHIAHELSLVPLLVAHLAGPVDHLDRRHPLIDGELSLTSKVVHVLHKRRHDLAESRVRLGAKRVNDLLRKGLAETLFLRSTAILAVGLGGLGRLGGGVCHCDDLLCEG